MKDPIDFVSVERKTWTPGIFGSSAFSLLKQKLVSVANLSTDSNGGLKEILSLYEMSCSETPGEGHISYVTVFGSAAVKIPAEYLKMVVGRVDQSRMGKNSCIAIQALRTSLGTVDTFDDVRNDKVQFVLLI